MAAAPPAAAAESPRRGEDVLDEALARLASTGPEYRRGLANHGPMAAEALVALGRPESVLPWVERYRRGLREAPEARDPLGPGAWADALGRVERLGDWIGLFDRQIGEHGWRATLGTWVPRLAPGLVAAATHGLIRTGHAARALAHRETPERRHELAQGLGYWAARFLRLPEAPGTPPGVHRPSEALSRVALLPPERRVSRGLITDALGNLEGFQPFQGVAGLADTSLEPAGFLSDLTATFAQVYLAQTGDFSRVITFVHAVTGPAALRPLLPHVEAAARPVLLRYGWQAAAALYAAIARPDSAPVVAPSTLSTDDLVDRAVASGDEHAIKFAEACLREDAVAPRPVYRAAAQDAVGRL